MNQQSSAISGIERKIRHLKTDKRVRKPLSDISNSSSYNVSKPVPNNVENLKRVNLSDLIKKHVVNEENQTSVSHVIEEDTDNVSLFDIVKKSLLLLPLLESNNHPVTEISVPPVHSTRVENNINKYDFQIPEDDYTLNHENSLTRQALSLYKSSINWFEATDFKYIQKDISPNLTPLKIKRIKKLNEFTFIVESHDNERIILHRMRHNQITESAWFSDENYKTLIDKKLILKTKEDDLSIDQNLKIPCYTKWYICI